MRRSRGRAGRTHCGSWTKRVPEGLRVLRLVCSEPVRHAGRHYSEIWGYEWGAGLPPQLRGA